MPDWIPRTDEEAERWWKEKHLEALERHDRSKRKDRRPVDLHDESTLAQRDSLKSYFSEVERKHGI